MTDPIFLILVFVMGACIGSFLNVLIWRLPREQVITGRSQCPHCKHQLHWLDLIPLLSYVLQRGRCRYCQTKISPRYFLIETITAVLFLAAALALELGTPSSYLLLVRSWLVISVCVVVFVVDLEHYLILDKIVWPAIFLVLASNAALTVVGGGLSFWGSPLWSGLLAGLLAAGGFWLLWFVSRGRWMGFGDVKFAGLMGLILGLPGVAIGLFMAFILGSLVGIPLLLSGRKQLSSKLPFGTFLAVSTLLGLFWGPAIWYWYSGLLGL